MCVPEWVRIFPVDRVVSNNVGGGHFFLPSTSPDDLPSLAILGFAPSTLSLSLLSFTSTFPSMAGGGGRMNGSWVWNGRMGVCVARR